MKRIVIVATLCAAAAGLTFALPELILTEPREAAAANTRIRVPQDQPTLQAAIYAAGPGFTISLTPGTYSENVVIAGKTDLRIDGRGSVLNGRGATALEILDSTMVSLKRLDLSNGTPYALLIHGNSADITISKCGFADAATAGVLVDNPVARVTIEKCSFAGLSGHGIRANSGASELRAIGNEFLDLAGIGIALAYEGGGIGVPNSVIEKNRLTSIGQHGIVFGGDGTTVAKNRIEGVTNGWGIAVDDSTSTLGCVIEGNRVSGTGGGGIRCLWSGATVTKNSVEDIEWVGLLAGGSGHLLMRNFVSNARTAGIRLTGTNTTAERNKVRQGKDDGFQVEGTGHTLLSNQSRGSNKYGYYVTGAGHAFTRNTAKENGDFDLWDLAGLGANTYVKNRFPKEKFGL
jgi:hypothetical protein